MLNNPLGVSSNMQSPQQQQQQQQPRKKNSPHLVF